MFGANDMNSLEHDPGLCELLLSIGPQGQGSPFNTTLMALVFKKLLRLTWYVPIMICCIFAVAVALLIQYVRSVILKGTAFVPALITDKGSVSKAMVSPASPIAVAGIIPVRVPRSCCHAAVPAGTHREVGYEPKKPPLALAQRCSCVGFSPHPVPHEAWVPSAEHPAASA